MLDVHLESVRALEPEHPAGPARTGTETRTRPAAGVVAPPQTEVVGHADDQGSDKVNDELSAKRADAVRALLVDPAAFERANYMKVLNSWRDLP